eukprot:c20308_g3_i2.p1 GENE.c20308_g3_i2~~c20308_g3_i2.p1  ORF type:complete len:178 (-),score=53.78 c20308_g3_i2:34-567(-)
MYGTRVICMVQATFAFIGLLVSSNFPDCDFKMADNGLIYIDCNHCSSQKVPAAWHAITFFILAFIFVCIGIAAALKRSKKLCFLYGRLMLAFAVVIGMSSMIGQLGFGEIENAVRGVRSDQQCFKSALKLLSTTQLLMLIYSIESLCDFAGAVFAIRSKELFEYEAISKLNSDYEVL